MFQPLDVLGTNVKCPFCGFINVDNAAYCSQCHKRIGYCLTCKAKFPDETVYLKDFCPFCGAPINPPNPTFWSKIDFAPLKRYTPWILFGCLLLTAFIFACATTFGFAAATISDQHSKGSFNDGLFIPGMIFFYCIIISAAIGSAAYTAAYPIKFIGASAGFTCAAFFATGIGLLVLIGNVSNSQVDDLAHFFWKLTAIVAFLTALGWLAYGLSKSVRLIRPA